MRVTRVLGIALSIVGIASACTCDAPERAPSVETEPHAPDPAPEPTGSSLPRALGELPSLSPMLTLAVHGDGFEVDNGALVDTWPEPDRRRVEAPRVRAEVATGEGDALLVPALFDAMQRAREVELARAAGGGTPIAFALRVDGDVPWRRVQQAVYSAGQAGWVEPRIVLRGVRRGDEVVLSIPLPRVAPSAAQRARLERELAALLGSSAPSAPEPEPEQPSPAPLVVSITGARDLKLAVRGAYLDATCTSAPSGAPAVTRAAREGAIDVGGLGACVDAALGVESLGIAGFALGVDPALPFVEIAPVLETLRASGDVSLVAS